jgi:hypothetical protein
MYILSAAPVLAPAPAALVPLFWLFVDIVRYSGSILGVAISSSTILVIGRDILL